jgi:UDP-N-acetylglucosamine 2-epimerase (non-hydrolysing)
MKKALIVFGTRPEYLKIKPILHVFQQHKVSFCLLQVLQHENLEVEEESADFFQKVVLPSDTSCQRLTNLAASISKAVEPLVRESSCLFVQGDTATAFFSALSAFHFQIPIYHIEAGLRTYDLQNPFPEEAYRSMISRIATYHLCPDEAAKQNLIKEGIAKNIYVVGNTILDLVNSYNMTSQIGNLVLITVHRRENWNQLPAIATSIHTLATQRPDLQFLWIYHPNPAVQESVSSTINTLGSLPNLQFEQPCSHKTLCQYIHDAYCIITDSGGIQEEASFLGKYCFVLRKVTERNAIPPDYIEMLESSDALLSRFQTKQIRLLPPCTVYGGGHASEKIFDIVNNLNQSASSNRE